MVNVKFRNPGLSEASRKTYEIVAKQFQSFVKEHSLVDTERQVTEFAKYCRESYAASTYNLKIKALKEFIFATDNADSAEWSFEMEKLFKSIPKSQTIRSVTKDKYITKNNLDLVCSKLESEDKNNSLRISLLIQSLFWTGLRISELLNVKHSDIALGEVATLTVLGKGAKQHRVYLPLKLYHRIVNVFAGRTHLLETRNGNPYHRVTATRMIKEKLSRYGYRLTAHSVGRHSFAMHLKERGLSPDKIAKALNHSSVVTTLECYFHGSPTLEELGLL